MPWRVPPFLRPHPLTVYPLLKLNDLAACSVDPAMLLNTTCLRIFYGLAACSWMPHWACHYYRLETHSTFVVGSWAFSFFDSVVSLVVYSVLIALNLLAISARRYQILAAALTSIGHLGIGLLHGYRLLNPFTFEVFGYSWTYGASLREVLIVVPFGILSAFVATAIKIESRHD